ncbi:DEAD/DEAH box helicase [Vagococcus fessus]|uniref:DNA/RNA helicase n=1 Tax=Vagococcus fessus TaxID=120370 RepID=A0A430ACB6_9ENTE|nr:helicase-related protein [Vagococcus fessus]RSU04856.1 hypothetical protein CBF31_02220 [Vagococcus fessus]
MEIDKALLIGRRLLLDELPYTKEQLEGERGITISKTMSLERGIWTCLRCGNTELVDLPFTDDPIKYCPACIMLGRVTNKEFFYGANSESIFHPIIKEAMTWDGTLSKDQTIVSERIVKVIEDKSSILIHAVTGAGKTEMLFKGIELALSKGYRVGIASPRVDVCIELYPRMKAAFSAIEVSLLYGKQDEPYFYSQLVVLTCHQLFRFYRAFDVLIIDEVDAFPYLNNRELEYASNNALKKKGSFIYLSATPPKPLLSKVRKGELEAITLAKRYHGYILPVPQFKVVRRWQYKLEHGKLDRGLKELLLQKEKKKRQVLIFCPSVVMLKKLVNLTQKIFPGVRQGFSYASDEERILNVQKMREEKYRWFFTTTILERGVTFPCVDVIVVGADHAVFNAHSLIQIAGRAGRSGLDPFGDVYFLYEGKSRAMSQAKKEIKKMNKLAKRDEGENVQ